MLDLQRLNAAYTAGYDDDKILESIERNDPEFGQRIKAARQSGYDSATIMGSIRNRLQQGNQQPAGQANQPAEVAEQPNQANTPANTPNTPVQSVNTPRKSPGIYESFKSGLAESSTGELRKLVNGDLSKEPQVERDFIDTFAHGIGDFLGNSPAFLAGGALGGTAGGAVAGPPGAAVGAGAGAMGLADFIKEELKQFREHRDSPDETFGDFLYRQEEVAGHTLRGAAMGGILSAINASQPLLRKIPGIGKLFETKIAGELKRPIAAGLGVAGAETFAAGTIPALSEGRLPDRNEYANAAALIFGLHIPRLTRIAIQKAGEKSGKTPEEFAESPEAKEILSEVKPETTPVEEANSEPFKVETETKKPEEPQSASVSIKPQPMTVTKSNSKKNPRESIDASRTALEALQDDIVSKSTSSAQKRIDALEAKINASNGKPSAALVKNLNIQKRLLAEAKKLVKKSVPKSPEAVNTKEPTLVHENTGKEQNPNVIKAIAQTPVTTLSQGAFMDSGWRPGFNWYSKGLRKTKRGTRAALRWVSKKAGVNTLKADPESSIYRRGFRAAEDFVSRKAVFKERFFTKWRENIHKNKEITKQDREDMIFYRERTGNPFIKGDTFEKLSKRMSEDSKRVVDTVIDAHMKESLAIMNESPFMQGKEVNPRQMVEDIYIRHFYSGKVSTEKINKIYEQQQARFGTDNPFKNKRTFLTFDQALREAGLVPKYRDIVQNLAAQDGMLSRVISNNELVTNLHNIESDMGRKLVLRSHDKGYKEARADGWVPFQDGYMRSYVAGKKKNGKLQWAVSEAPALVHPDLAPSMQGIFNRDAYKPDNAAVRMYDMYNSAMNQMQVKASLFHFNALSESMVGSGGFLTSMVMAPKWWRQGTRFLEKSHAVEDAVRHGLTVNRPTDLEFQTANTMWNQMLTTMQASKSSPIRFVGNKLLRVNALSNIHKFLFGSFQPRMKVVTYENYVERTLKQFAKKGVHPNEELLREIKREAASTVNDQFGGQNFELIPFFNNKSSKGLSRLISYPDWTVSAIREVSNAFASNSPLRRKLGQRYLIQYGLGLAFGTQMLSLLTTGLTNKSDGSVTWDWEKAHTTFKNKDPKRSNFFDIEMPDVYVTIAGQKVNIGRDENGRKYYMHAGKKVREIAAYFDHPVAAVFSKSTPAIRLGTKYALDYTPSADGLFPVRGAYVEGEFRPWDGSKKWTIARAKSYAKELIGSSLPFSVQTVVSDYFNSEEAWYAALARAGLKFTASAGGALSVSKGISLHSSEQYYEKALQLKDPEKQQSLNALRAVLRNNGYSTEQIDRIQNKIKNRVTKQAKPR